MSISNESLSIVPISTYLHFDPCLYPPGFPTPRGVSWIPDPGDGGIQPFLG